MLLEQYVGYSNLLTVNSLQSNWNRAKSAAPTRKTNYIDIRHHILQKLTKDGIITPNYVPTAELVADAFTKPLSADKYMKHSGAMQLTILPHPRLYRP